MIQSEHAKNGHVGTEQVLASLRNEYWILSGRSVVREQLSKGFACRRLKAPLGEKQMAPLLEEQLKAGEPVFAYTGVDLFGPLLVKIGRSTVKRYGCIFSCITTRAVHLEIVHSLSTDSFMAALIRFMARRGQPCHLCSDQGTNFTAAEKELKGAARCFHGESTRKALSARRIEWDYNPPHASHRGGLWERLIRPTRTILRSLIGQQLLNTKLC